MATSTKRLRGLLAATTAALCLSAGAQTAFAQQGLLPQGVPPEAIESYVDQYGREVFLDIDGRVVAVVHPSPKVSSIFPFNLARRERL